MPYINMVAVPEPLVSPDPCLPCLPRLLQDVVYYFKPVADCTVTASLCGSASLANTFDSRLYMLADVDSGGNLRATACSNNACGMLPSLTASVEARSMTLLSG